MTSHFALRPLALSCLLAACGGGGGGDAAAPPAANLTISGTAATGQALVGATVTARCAAGSGNATTGADGRYSISVEGGRLPCVLRAAPVGGGLNLHSAIDGDGSVPVTANVTPLTELIVARAAGQSPALLYEAFDAAAQARIGTLALQSAVASVGAALSSAVDLTGVNPVTDMLVAATASSAGNALDGKLDQLQATLSAARTTLQELTAAIADNSSSAAPVLTMLQPAAASCTGLRTGRYAVLAPVENRPEESGVTMIDVDAVALTLTMQEGASSRSTSLVDDGGCAYSIADDGESSTRIVVARSSLMVARDLSTTGSQAGQGWVSGVFVPLQSIALSELSGSWNVLEYFRDPINGQDSLAPDRYQLSFDSTGTIVGGTNAEVIGARLSVNAAGGFDIGGSAVEPPSRVFAYRASNGRLSMFLKYSTARGWAVMTQQAALSLPALNQIDSFWDVTIGSDGFASALSDATTTITAVDAASGTYTRRRRSDRRVDSFTVNQPQSGLRARAADSCTIDGAPSSCAGITVMPLPGTGVAVYTGTGPGNFFGLSVTKP
jgi:hypothetical protein